MTEIDKKFAKQRAIETNKNTNKLTSRVMTNATNKATTAATNASLDESHLKSTDKSLKGALVQRLIAKLEADRSSIAEAALHTYEAATHEESEAEDQYDTRGLEASYLAGAQAKRVAEIEQTLHTVKTLKFRDFTEADPIGATALVELEHDGKVNYCLLLPQGGGMSVDHNGYHVQVITPKSPLGEALVGRLAGDVAVIDVNNQTKEYEILSVS